LNNSIRGGIRFVGIDDPAEWEKFQQMYPDYLKLEITANYANFSAHTKTVSVPGDCSVIIAREDVPDEVIYEVVKSIFDNLEETRAITGAVRDLELNIALEGCNIPVHTGALKYYKDKGLDVSKFEK
ncbi:MAG: TAXI family TRAP transporter solute-binding subunit, partial [Dehalobacterium sp.]